MRFAGNKILAALFSGLFLAGNANAGVELGIDVLESNGFALLNMNGVTFSEYRGGAAGGSYLRIEPEATANLTAINVHALAEMNRQLHRNVIASSSRGEREMFFKCYGSASIQSEFARGNGPGAIIAGWADDVVRFKGDRGQYLLY